MRSHIVYAGNEERQAKLLRLMGLVNTDSLTDATWAAIDFYLKHRVGRKAGIEKLKEEVERLKTKLSWPFSRPRSRALILSLAYYIGRWSDHVFKR